MKKKELIFFMSKKTKIVAIQGDKLKTINKDTDTSLLLALEAQKRGYKITTTPKTETKPAANSKKVRIPRSNFTKGANGDFSK